MKNLNDIRLKALENLELLKVGKIDKEYMDAFCKVSNLILYSLKVEIDYLAKAPNAIKSIDFIEGESLLKSIDKK